MMQRLMVILVVLLLLAGGVLYAVTKRGPHTEPASSAENRTSAWKTYRNEKYGVEFKYPRELGIRETERRFVALLDKDGLVSISVDLDAKYLLDWDIKTRCPGPGFPIILKKINVGGYETILCKEVQDRPYSSEGATGGTLYRILVPKEKSQTRANQGSYIIFEANIRDGIKTVAEGEQVVEEILATFKFIRGR